MPHVVTENCALCRFTECIAVCPVECFHADAERVYIDPDVCIDCGACIPACPVRAIADSIDLAPENTEWIDANRERSAALPLITQKQPPLPTAERRRAELGH
jgi:ferredoxin